MKWIVFFSIFIPTYNHLPIVVKYLKDLENQILSSPNLLSNYEIVVVDDDVSNDDTCLWLETNKTEFPYV